MSMLLQKQKKTISCYLYKNSNRVGVCVSYIVVIVTSLSNTRLKSEICPCWRAISFASEIKAGTFFRTDL